MKRTAQISASCWYGNMKTSKNVEDLFPDLQITIFWKVPSQVKAYGSKKKLLPVKRFIQKKVFDV